MSETGAITLPQAVRDAHGFAEGAEFEVIDGDREIMLRVIEAAPERPKKKLTLDEFVEMIPRYEGPPITDAMIEEAVLKEAKRRWDEKNSR
jgi:bifunctional DNA-binding transcriptional regulator/antitoxin component of YhaV-PrlF toxin-antitoxin module